jgi:hypothetical protein
MPEITKIPTEEKEGERRIDLSEIIGLPDFDVGPSFSSNLSSIFSSCAQNCGLLWS